MREPWDLAQDFINNQQAIAREGRMSADNVLLNMIRDRVAQGVAQTSQGYALDRMGVQNQYATTADTIANERLGVRDQRLRDWDVTDAAQTREWAVSDAAAGAKADAIKRAELQQGDERVALINQEINPDTGRRMAPSGVGGTFPGSTQNYINNTVNRESAGNPNAKNPNSSAEGLFQITDGTFQDLLKIDPTLRDKNDPRAMALLTSQNEKVLSQNGIPITDANRYAAHFLGAGGAVRALRHGDEVPLASVIGADQLAANPHLRGMSVGDFRAWTEKHGGGSSSGTQTATNGVRRYVDPGAAIPNSQGSTARQAIEGETTVAIMPQVQEQLNRKNQEAISRVQMPMSAYEHMPPAEQRNWMLDWGTAIDPNLSDKDRAKTWFLRVRPKETEGVTGLDAERAATASPAGKVTAAEEVIVTKRENGVAKDYKKMPDGSLVELVNR